MTAMLEGLRVHLLELSESDKIEEAILEWRFTHAEVEEEYFYCPCGQRIVGLCYLHNIVTEAETYVGNVCVQKFLKIPEVENVLFAGLRRIKKNPEANPNEAVINYAAKRGYIWPREVAFLQGILHKRSLSMKQASWREKINRRILKKTVVAPVRN